MKNFIKGLQRGLIYSLICGVGSFIIIFGYFSITDYLNLQKQKEVEMRNIIKSQQESQTKLQKQMEQDKIETQAKIDQSKADAQAQIAAERRINQIAQANLKKQIDDKPATVIQNNTIVKQEIDISAIVKEWRPQVGYILCDFGSYYGTGSGLLRTYTTDKRLIIQTNRHVMNRVKGCAVRFPDNLEIFTVKNDEARLMWISSVGQDWGFMYLPTYNTQLNNTRLSGNCVASASVGDKIIVIGYPGVGATRDITVTEGIISGFDGDYYITSAKIEHGNSGGAAIDLKRNCYLGIPTFVVVGSAESLGRILDINKIK